MIKSTASIPTKFCIVINTTEYLFVGSPNTHRTNLRWQKAAILKTNEKIAISQQLFDRSHEILLDDALNRLTVKKIDFLKIKMADGRHLETVLIAMSQQRFDGLPWNLVTWWRTLTLSSLSTIKLSFLNEGKNAISQQRFNRSSRNMAWWLTLILSTAMDRTRCCVLDRLAAPKEPRISCTLAPSGEYDWTIRARIRVCIELRVCVTTKRVAV